MALVRDRETWFVYVATIAYGWTFYALGPAFSFLRDEQQTSRTVSSLHSLALAVGLLVTGLLGDRITARLGRAATLRLGIVCVGAGVVWLCVGPNPWLTIPSVVLVGFGGSSLINNGIAFLDVHHNEAKTAAIAEATGLSGIANLIAPLGLGAGVAVGWGWRAGVLVAVPMYVGALLIRVNRAIVNRPSSAHDLAGPLPLGYWRAWLVLVSCFGAEYSLALWAVDLLRNQGGLSPAAAAAGLAAFTAGLTVSRLVSARWLPIWDPERTLRTSLLIPAVAWIPLWLSTNGWVMLGALLVIGAGVGLNFPLNMERLIRASGGHADRAVSRSSLAASLAAASAPTGLGALGDLVGIHQAFVLVEVFLLLALGLALLWPVRD